MGKYISPKIRIIRRLGILPGMTQKSDNNRLKPPGQHGKPFIRKTRKFISEEFKDRLIEKQKLRYNFGVNEKQLHKYYLLSKKISNKCSLITFLESRLDAIVFRIGFARSIPAARQLINHGHIVLNNKKITIPSFICKKNDTISFSTKNKTITNLIKLNFHQSQKTNVKTFKRHNAILQMKKNLLKKFGLYKPLVIKLLTAKVRSYIPNYIKINSNPISAKVISKIVSDETHIYISKRKINEYYSK